MFYNRLNLPGEIEENDSSSGSYDCEKGDFSLRFSKVNKGEHFENLDMISSLLLPSTNKPSIPTIEVISTYEYLLETLFNFLTKIINQIPSIGSILSLKTLLFENASLTFGFKQILTLGQ